jgi:hypothetical protein
VDSGFIIGLSDALDGRSTKSKKSKRKAVGMKQVFEIVPQVFSGEKMRRYFSPQSAIESQLIGLKSVR